MAGKAIIHGFNQGFIAGGIVTIVLNGEKAYRGSEGNGRDPF